LKDPSLDRSSSKVLMISAALSFYLGELLRPHFGFFVWVSMHNRALLFYELFEPDSQATEAL
jgi:hypothetical protein